MYHFSVKTDTIMWSIQRTLQMDLGEYLDEIRLDTLEDVRASDYNIPKYADPYRVKAKLQVQGWLKRYCFEHDILDDETREEKTKDKFLSDQLRIGVERPLTFRSQKVLSVARSIIRRTLGAFDEDELISLCTFSRKSVVGYPLERSYLDEKIHPGSIVTGTEAEIAWFDNYVKSDSLLYDSLVDKDEDDSNGVKYVVVSQLTQSYVAKTAKIDRAVRPNTLIGSFRSIGLGRMVAKRLLSLGINVRTQQELHKTLAKSGSRLMHNVTMDLSSASDSFTPALINRLIPRRWYNELKLGRTPRFCFGGDKQRFLYSPSFMAMGIGFTFPVMTLCYMAILLAIQHLSGIKGKISVFGDDLIFPIRMYPYVLQILTDVGFKVNEDKTFWDRCFRESCGGDYFDSVDVRPASPKGVSELLEGGPAISAYVYKLFNSLIRRWEEVELPFTFGYLRDLLQNLGLESHSVPPHFPDTSGFKDGKAHGQSEEKSTDLRKPYFGSRIFPCIIQRESLRPVGHMGIFLWEKLQGNTEPSLFSDSSDVLLWKTVKKRHQRRGSPPVTYRKMVAYTARKGVVYFEPGSIRF